jgi:hypothetical protein
MGGWGSVVADPMRFPTLHPVCLVAASLLASPVSAQDSEVDAQAQIHFQSGRMHFDRGDYEEALAEFESAYQLSGRPGLLYNIYLSHQNLGQLEEAANALRKYLDEGELSEEERRTLTARLANLDERVAEQRAQDQAAAGAAAQTGPGGDVPVEAGHRHTGFFLRGNIGPGYVTASVADFTLTGGATPGALAVGWCFFENLAFQLEFFGGTMVGGRISHSSGLSITDDSARYTAGGIGVGVTYWFMPINIYVSGTLGGGGTSVERGGVRTESDVGFAMALAAGKEFWVGEEWGLGGALSFYLYSNRNRDEGGGTVDDTLTASVIGLQVVLTYN